MTNKILYASALGAHLDSNVISGGGTDDTAVLQAALDLAPALGTLRLVIDGAALVTGLDIHSNTTIECLSSVCGFYLANGADRPIVRNAHPSADIRADQNIQILGGTYNGNSKHQVHHTQENNWVVPLAFFGIENLIVRDIEIRDQRTFALHLGQWKRVNLENIHIALPETKEQTNQDGIHVNGPGQFLTARNISGKSWDDFFAINADDGNEPLSQTQALGPWVKEGDITDVLVDGLIIDDASQGVRLLSWMSRLDRVTIRNLTGHNRTFGVFVDNYQQTGGNFGSIVLDSIDLYQHDTLPELSAPFLITVGGKIEHLTLRNISRNNSFDARPSLEIEEDADIRLMHIEGFHIYENTLASENVDYIIVRGSVQQLVLRNVDVFREGDLASGGTLVRVDATKEAQGIQVLSISNVVTHNLKHLVNYQSGYLENIQAANIRDGANDSASFVVNGSVKDFLLTGYSGNTPFQTTDNGEIVAFRNS